MSRVRAILTAALLLPAWPVSAQEASGYRYSGNYWAEMCAAPELSDRHTKCIDYLYGFTGAIPLDRTYCAPVAVTYNQMARIVANYVARNPRQLHWDFALLVRAAMTEAYPCPNTDVRR